MQRADVRCVHLLMHQSKKQKGCMAAHSKEKKEQFIDKIDHGPGIHDLNKAIQSLMQDRESNPHIPFFGNGYREYPIRFTSVRIYRDAESELTLYDIEGVMDWTGHSTFNHPQKVLITGYSPRTRQAKSGDYIGTC
jgi:hypothetical protein